MVVDLICHSDISFKVAIQSASIRNINARIDFNFDVKIESEYSVKYFANYQWGDREQHRIEILDRDGEGLGELLHLASEGFYIEYGGKDKDILDPIFISQGKLQIFDPDNSIRLTLYTIDPRKYKLIHYVNGEVSWVGYLLPEQYFRPLRLAKSAIEILATDALGELQELIYGEVFDVSNSGLVRLSIKDFIVKILSQLNYDIPYEFSFAWYPHGVESERVLESVQVGEISFRGRTLYEILQSLLLILGSRLYQESGRWITEQVEKKSGPYIIHRYNYLGTFIESVEIDTRIDAGFAEDSEIKFRSSSGYETFRGGYNKVKMITEVDRKDAPGTYPHPVGMPGVLFDGENGYYAKIKNYDFRFWKDANTPLFVTLSENANIERSTDGALFTDYSLQINNILGSQYFSFKLDTIQPGQNVGLFLRFYIKRVGTGLTLFTLSIRIGNKYARWNDDEGAIIFLDGGGVISYSDLDEGYNSPLTNNEWQERRLTINRLPQEGGELEIYFSGGITFTGSYQGLRYDLIRPLLTSDPVRITYEARSDESLFDRTKEIRDTFITDELIPHNSPRINSLPELFNTAFPTIVESHWKRIPYEVDEQPSGKSLADLVTETHLLLQSDKLIQRDEEYLQRKNVIPVIAFRNTLQIQNILYIPVWMKKLFMRGLIAGQWVQIGTVEEPEPEVFACMQYWDSEFEGQAVDVFEDDFGNYYLEIEE